MGQQEIQHRAPVLLASCGEEGINGEREAKMGSLSVLAEPKLRAAERGAENHPM